MGVDVDVAVLRGASGALAEDAHGQCSNMTCGERATLKPKHSIFVSGAARWLGMCVDMRSTRHAEDPELYTKTPKPKTQNPKPKTQNPKP